MIQNLNPFREKIFVFVTILFLFTFSTIMTGCSTFSGIVKTTNRMIRDFKAPDDDLKKKVAVVFFENETALDVKELEEGFMKDLTGIIRSSCPEIILEKPGDPGYPDALVHLPKQASGRLDNFELAKIGRQLGYNAIITGSLQNIATDQKKKGIWWFKNIHHYIQVQLVAEVYDSETGAKLLDESFMKEIEVDESDLESSNVDLKIRTYVINEAFMDIADHMGEKICNALVLNPWHGYIISTDADKMIISSGKNVGIRTGDVFEVYNSIDTFQGVAGYRFFIPGPKIGEIKITRIHSDIAEAVRVSGHDIRVGFSIRPKN